MTWHAKPSGGYAIGSDEWKDNINEINSMLYGTWTPEAIAGMCGNIQSESGMNPWRWQNDTVNLTSDTEGYGLPQFTPAYGYVNDYGKGVEGYAPNMSVTEITIGASPTDGKAQIIVIDTDKAGKYINRASYCKFADISPYYPFSNFKSCEDAWLATVAWLYNYEFPASQYRTEQAARARYANTSAVYEYLHGMPPPKPPTNKKMPIYMYRRYKRWLC